MQKNKEFGLAEKIAIGTMCIGTASLIVFFLLPKTPIVIVVSLFLVFVMIRHAATIFVPIYIAQNRSRKFIKYTVTLLLFLFCFWAGISVWPDMEPTSDIIIERTELFPYEIGKSPQVNLHYFNYSVHTIRAHEFSFIYVGSGTSSLEQEEQRQEMAWNYFRENVGKVDSRETGFTSRTGTWSTIAEDSPKTHLTKDEYGNLIAGNGETTIYFMAALLYKDSTGEHELDYCAYTQRSLEPRPVVLNCRQHNGPAEPMPHRPFYKKKWFYLWLN